jgi:hypothetical protein
MKTAEARPMRTVRQYPPRVSSSVRGFLPREPTARLIKQRTSVSPFEREAFPLKVGDRASACPSPGNSGRRYGLGARALPKYISSQMARSSKRSTRKFLSNFSIVTLPVKR